jgi:RNA-binding protein Nova
MSTTTYRIQSDGMAAAILGSRGAVKDDIQARTRTRLVFSNRNDYFPRSQQRVLGIFCDESEGIMLALEAILPKFMEVAEDERRSPPAKGGAKGKSDEEMLAKVPGEYVFRLCISQHIASVLIGSGGSNIKEIRQESGAKVLIGDDTVQGHRLVRVIGPSKEILRALRLLNEYVQRDAGSEEFFSSYSSVINFGLHREADSHHRAGASNGADRGQRDGGDRRGITCYHV